MGTVTVLYGPAYNGKTDAAFQKLLNALRRHEGRTCAYLVRSDVRVRQLRERVFQELSGNFSVFPVWTLPDFLKRVYQQTPGAKRILGELEQKILLEEMLTDSDRVSQKLSYFTDVRERPGILNKIQEFLAAVRRQGIAAPEELAQAFQQCRGRHQTPFDALLSLYALYHQALERAQAIDEVGIFLELAHKANAGSLRIQPWISPPQLLVLEGYYELTPPVQQIFTALCAQFEQSILTLACPVNPYHVEEIETLPKPFHLLRDITQYIRRSGFSVREYSSSFPGKAKTVSQTTDHDDPFHLVNRPPDSMRIQACHNRKDEVIRIAREIRTLWRNHAVNALREIGVAFPVIEHYAELIQEIFPLYGIPFTMFQGYALAVSPVVTTLFRAAQVILDDYTRESLQHLFASPLLRLQLDDQASDTSFPLCLDSHSYPSFDNLAQELGISGGRSEWLEALTQAESHLTEQQEQGDQNERLAAGSVYIPVFLRLLEFLARFEPETRYPCEEYLQFFQEILWRLQVPQRVLETDDPNIREKDCAALQRLLQVFDRVQHELSLSSVHRRGSQRSRYSRCTLREFTDFFRTLIQDERCYPPGKLDDSVFILGRLDTRQVRFQYLFFGGLIEKDFPGQETPNIFLSQQDAELLGLPSYTDALQEAAHLFYLNTLNPVVKLYLSYPRQEAEKDVLRSTYIERLLKVLEDENVQAESETPEVQSLEELYNYTEVYQWLGQRWDVVSGNDALSPIVQFIAGQQGAEAVKYFLRRVEAQQQRNSAQLSRFDGVLTSRWAHNRLRTRYAHHIYSVSEFDLYARCPMKFFFRRILRLEPRPEILPTVSARDIGDLLHKIVFRFYAGASTRGESDQDFLRRRQEPDTWLNEARQRIADIAREELAAYPFSGAFWEMTTRTILAGLPGYEQETPPSSEPQGILARFVEQESLDREKVAPRYLEARFGMANFRPDAPEQTDSGISGYQLSAAPYVLRGHDADGRPKTIRLRGTIDRIDVESSDASAPGLKAVIYDYKTGGLPSAKALNEGRSFQLPLYLLAARDLLDGRYEVAAAGYYLLKSPQEVGKSRHLGSKEHAAQRYFKGSSRTLRETYQEVLAVSEHYADLAIQRSQEIQTGIFHPTTLGAENAGCDWCEYRQVCRVNHQRMKTISG